MLLKPAAPKWRDRLWSLTSELQYRLPMLVNECHILGSSGVFPVCPRCRCTFDREYTSFCDRCGQRLDWQNYEFAVVIKK